MCSQFHKTLTSGLINLVDKVQQGKATPETAPVCEESRGDTRGADLPQEESPDTDDEEILWIHGFQVQ